MHRLLIGLGWLAQRIPIHHVSLEGVPQEQKMLKGHLPRVVYHQVYKYTKIMGPGAAKR